jgi:hypothetical protein
MLQPFLDAIARIFSRRITPSGMTSRQWQATAPAIRQRAFFSSTVTSAKVLTAYRRSITDWMSGVVEQVTTPDGRIETAYKVSGLSDFRKTARKFLASEGLATPADLADDSIQNVASLSRLQLVFNTNIEQANTFANYQQYVSDPVTINAFPAARFLRRPGAKIKRPRHVQAEGEIRRWDDTAFWLFQNAADIGGFGVPWGPFGFNSYMVAEPVTRAVSDSLGLTTPGERVMPLDLTPWGAEAPARINAGVEARLDDVPDDIAVAARQRLVERFGPQVLDRNGNPTLDFARSLLRR